MENIKKTYFKKFEGKQFSYYKLEKFINKGDFSAVFKSINKENNKNYAIKMMLKSDIDDEKKFLNECDMMKNSINVIKYYEIFEENEFYFIVMELCDLNLLEYLNNKKNISLYELREILIQFNNALKYMFDNNII